MIPEIVAAQMVTQAGRSSGLLVRLSPEEFSRLVSRTSDQLVVVVEGDSHYHYLTSHKGVPFYTRSQNRLQLPPNAEVVIAEGMSLPD
jgi:hypothetical protein